MHRLIIYCLLVFFLCQVSHTSGLLAKESVPVLIWSNERQPIATPAVAALPIPFSQVERKYLKSFNQNNILLFLQDAISVEDLSSHEDVFKHIGKFMENGHSLYLPAVEVGNSIPDIYAIHGYNIVTLEPGSAVAELKLESNSKNLVVVKLPSTTTNPSRARALQKNAEIMSNVISKIGNMADFTIIYTGLEPSVKLKRDIEHRRTTRAVKAACGTEITDDKFHCTNCVLLYLPNDIVVQKGNQSSYSLSNHTKDISNCQDDTEDLTIYYKDIGEITKIFVQIHFTRSARRWTVDHVILREMVKNSVDAVFLYPQYPMENVPMNKSFVCSKTLVFQSNHTEESQEYRMYINGMQVEAFTGGDASFDNSWDCVGFFTIPIWMGLFAGLLFTFILLVGFYMLFDVKTMDRFDDPKGKHFMVTATSE